MAMDTYAERTCFWVKRGRRYQRISYQRFQRLAFRLTSFLCQHGVCKGERVAIVADNPLEWMVVYIACLLAGGVVVPLRAWLSPDTLQTLLRDSGACLAIVQGKEQHHIIQEAGKGLPDLRTVLVVEDDIPSSYPGVTSIASIVAQGLTSEEVEALRNRAERVESEALALIYYKSNQPKGVVFNHAQRLGVMRSMAQWFMLDEDDIALTTNLSWSLAMLNATLYYFLSGVAHVLAESSEGDGIQQTSPTVTVTTPSIIEGFYNRVMHEVSHLPSSRQVVFQWALTIGREYRAAGLSASKELREAYARADQTFFNQIRGELGGRLYRLYSTGAPLPQTWAEFVEIVGLLPLNIYSLTEAGGFPAVSQPNARRPDSVGQVAPDFQIRIADDGEVLVRGPMIMAGYWQKPEETRQVIDADGWLHTGDLGRFDQDGYLYITGHKQSLIRLSTGRNVMPIPIENELIASPFINQAVVVGEGRPYISALIAPDLTAIADHLSPGGRDKAGLKLTITQDQIRKVIDEVVDEVNHGLDGWGQIKEYTLLKQPFTEASGELTASQKIRRQVIIERYMDQIEAMYPQTIQLVEKEITEVTIDPEHLRELLEKQDILDAWLADAGIGFLFDLARAKQIDTISMVHIADTVATIAQMQNEEKPLSTALIVGDPIQIARDLPESEIKLQRYDHIRRMRQIMITLSKIVDGLVLAYVVDKHGYIRGIHKLMGETRDEPDNFLLGPQFRRHAAISLGCNALVFFVPSGGRQVRVFADGRLVGRYANGGWSSENIARIEEVLAQLAEHKKYELSLLRRILRCAFQMSEENLGAIFLLGDAEFILERSDPPEISPFATIVGADVRKLMDRELINFAKQDGATVIDVDGTLKGYMVLLRPSAVTQAEIGPGKGARHSSAAKMSAEADCLAIAVSQDGPITIYDSGQRVLSL